MANTTFDFTDIPFFNSLVKDYLSGELSSDFYGEEADLEGFKNQIENIQFSKSKREVLVTSLKKQYKGFSSEMTINQIASLSRENTYTITTGHQLNLATGPLYFLYKIAHVISLSEYLNTQFTNCHFVPVYWMATEDHDFAEINHFFSEGKKFVWESEQEGAVGRFSTKGTASVINALLRQYPSTPFNDELNALLVGAYQERSLSEATRKLVHQLFGDKGLVVIDADCKDLKGLAKDMWLKELEGGFSAALVEEQNARLETKGYPIQVNPREINLFYLEENKRIRIIKEDTNTYSLADQSIRWTKRDLLDEVQTHPERISPNVLLRPLYQETILPNLAYIGGGGELSYWLQLKTTFESVNLRFPILIARNSFLLVDQKTVKKSKALDLDWIHFFKSKDALINFEIRRVSNIDLDFTPAHQLLEDQFIRLRKIASETDKSFEGAVNAQEKKQKKGLQQLEKRLLKAQKRVLSDHVSRIAELYDVIKPLGGYQERIENFSYFYNLQGKALIEKLVRESVSIQGKFIVLEWDT
jgi:bacillithiol biosynthesis cysteine-adding enzyme BshC